MFNKLRRYYNQNRTKIWRIVGIIAFIIILIQLANYISGISLNNENNKKQKNTISKTELQTESIISDTKIGEKTATNNNEAIEKFVNYCNEGDINSAYNMLTDECKEVCYKSIDDFKNYYYNQIFTGKKLYTKENWYSDDNLVTYRVVFTNDILADGGKKSEETFGDYITAVKLKDETKLNINQFITKETIDKKYEDSHLTIEVKEQQIHRLYEIYEINFTNNAANEITLYDTSVNTDSEWYVMDKKSNKSDVAIGEISSNLLTIQPGETKTLKVKFMKTYNPDKKTKKICLENIICNNEKIDIELKL